MASVRRTLPLLLVLLLAAGLRLPALADAPGWFADEGTHLSLAHNLLRGRTQYLALTGSTLLAARLPLFDWLLAGCLAVAGAGPAGDPARGMGVLRALTGTLGVASTGLLWLAARRLGGPRGAWLGLLAAGAYAVYPQAIVYSRLGFSYNLLSPLLLLVVWGLGEFQRALAGGRLAAARGWLALASLAAGLAAVTDVWGWVLLAPLAAGAVLGARWAGARARAGLLLAAVPPALYAAWMLASVPAAFVFDLGYLLGRLGGLSVAAQIARLADNLLTLFAQEGWLAVGALGLFWLRPARLRRLALLFFWLPLVLVGRSGALTGLSFYYLIPLLPLAALGLGALALRGLEALGRWAGLGRWAALGVGLWLAAAAAGQARAGFPTGLDPFLLDPADARGAAAFVNAQAAPNDVVIASPGLAWRLAANAADYEMALARAGTATPHLPAGLPPERFAFDPRFERARFVVVDNLWRSWAVFHLPGLAEQLAGVERWPAVFSAGEITVFERPGD